MRGLRGSRMVAGEPGLWLLVTSRSWLIGWDKGSTLPECVTGGPGRGHRDLQVAVIL